MSDESIIIEVNDKVDGSIATKIRTIAKESRTAYSDLQKLQLALNSLNANSLSQIVNSMNSAQNQINRTALSAQRLATEQNRTAESASNLAAAESRAESAAIRLKAAQEQAAKAVNSLEREAEQLRRSLNPLYAAQQEHREELQRVLVMYKQGAIGLDTYNAAVTRSTERMNAANMGSKALETGLVKTGAGSRIASHHLANLGFQLNDIGVSLASGQKPLTVFIQQGAQIAQIAAQAQVSMWALARAAAAMVAPFLPLVAVLGAAYTAFSLWQNSIESSAGLEKYAKDLGLTEKQIEKNNLATITFGDTLNGLWSIIDKGDRVSGVFSTIGGFIKDMAVQGVENVLMMVSAIRAHFIAMVDVLIAIWNKFPPAFKAPIIAAINVVIEAFELFINDVVKGINLLIQGINKVNPGKALEEIGDVSLGRLKNNAESEGRSIGQVYSDSFNAAYEEGITAGHQFFEDINNAIVGAAKDRIKEFADENKKAGKAAGDSGKKYAEAMKELAKFNKELEQNIMLLQMLPKEREIEQQLLQLTNSLAEKGLVLTKAQNEALRERLRIQQDIAAVSQAKDTLLSDSVGKRDDFSATLEGLDQLRGNKQSGFTEGDQNTAVSGLLGDMGIDTSLLQSSLDGALAQYQVFYEQLKALRDGDFITESDYANARAQLVSQENQIKLSNFSQFFEGLTALQSSSIKELAAIGKGAAIAQATINVYEGMTKAIAQGGIAGLITGATVLAQGLAIVTQMKSQSAGPGYMTGGYTGNSPINKIVGNVHGQEFVNSHDVVKREGVANFQALQNGTAHIQKGDEPRTNGTGGTQLKVSVKNYGNNEVTTTQLSHDEVEVMIRERTPKIMMEQVNDPNSGFNKTRRNTEKVSRRL